MHLCITTDVIKVVDRTYAASFNKLHGIFEKVYYFLIYFKRAFISCREYDGFNVYLNRKGMNKPMQKYVPKEKPSMVLLEDPDLEPGMTYQVVVKTVSGKVYSRPTTQNVTLVLE